MPAENYLSEIKAQMRETLGPAFLYGSATYQRVVNLMLEARARELESCLKHVDDAAWVILSGKIRDLREAKEVE